MQEILTNTKVSIKTTKNGATGFLLGQTEIYSKEVMKGISETVMDKCSGQMGVTIKVNGKMVFRMEKVSIFFNSG